MTSLQQHLFSFFRLIESVKLGCVIGRQSGVKLLVDESAESRSCRQRQTGIAWHITGAVCQWIGCNQLNCSYVPLSFILFVKLWLVLC
jgi:hypothetical protein